jgi:hypothetical protein
MANPPSLLHVGGLLFLKAVQVLPLDANDQPIRVTADGKVATASGFIRTDGGRPYLYTCWHVVTGGINPHRIELPPTDKWVRPESLRIRLQLATVPQENVTSIGGSQEITIPLYDREPKRPRWAQDPASIVHEDLNRAGFQVPFWHDAVKVPLPEGIAIADVQSVDSLPAFASVLVPGDRVLIVGYPFGYSALGIQQPTPVVMTRYVASNRTTQPKQFLLDGGAAPGMSGSPVFVERDEMLHLIGLYTGEAYPQKGALSNPLGTCADITFCWHVPEMWLLCPPFPALK